jgi:hypothetical protein
LRFSDRIVAISCLDRMEVEKAVREKKRARQKEGKKAPQESRLPMIPLGQDSGLRHRAVEGLDGARLAAIHIGHDNGLANRAEEVKPL